MTCRWEKMPQSHIQVIRGGNVVTIVGPNKPQLVKAMCVTLPTTA